MLCPSKPCRFSSCSPLLAVFAIAFVGCSDPEVQPIEGKITLGGKPYTGLVIYMRPTDRLPSAGSIGIGQTDADGNLTLKSSAGIGLEPGATAFRFRSSVALRRLQTGNTKAWHPRIQLKGCRPPTLILKKARSHTQ